MSKDPRHRELKKAWKEQEHGKLVASIPMPHQDLRALLDHLDWSGVRCDHTLRETTAFIHKLGLDVGPVVAWLREHGGYCDCEVIANVGDQFGEIVDKESGVGGAEGHQGGGDASAAS